MTNCKAPGAVFGTAITFGCFMSTALASVFVVVVVVVFWLKERTKYSK